MNAQTEISPDSTSAALVRTKLGRLNVVSRGHGNETIILWPSIFTDHHIYDALTETLRDRFRFLLIDGPAHGASEGPDREFSMRECGYAILDIMDHFGVRQAIIGGTSWGGLAAAEAAILARDRVKALILMNTPMGIDGAQPELSARMIAWGARWSGQRRFFQNGVAKSFFSKGTLQADPEYRQRFYSMLCAANPQRLSVAIRSVILRGTPLKSQMTKLPMPTLVIAGKSDEMYPIETQAEAALLAPNGVFEPVGGKHISVVETPDAVAGAIVRFTDARRAQ